ncbi:MAG: hypothetical protein Q8Q59_00205 [Luteolibacter sp.]|jgi:hypothetical protein|nr:hypothetical protein [Luteolibacter sp.]
MNPRALQNNEDLFEYLVQLGESLQIHKKSALAEIVNQASRFASGSASEFMHEAQVALDLVKKDRPEYLSADEMKYLNDVIAQIQEAFQKIGGA